LAATLESGSWAASTRGVARDLDGDEVRPINRKTKGEVKLSEALDDVIASDEEDEELNEEDRVEAAAGANRGS
jgi:hypothetical protein